MASWEPPEGVREVVVFGDSDRSFTGQAAAYQLAKRLRNMGIEVDVRIPDGVDIDWADIEGVPNAV
jgi:putative DNA primase/helicase